ncbi:MAG: alkaline phosphatase family protein [Rhodocyclaceae bacterium]|nr:alkaline phosphatase family protein [Rhodocyclaceae bacterium]
MTQTFQPSLPDYRGGSIVNLMASVASAVGGDALAPYPPLGLLPPEELADARNIILLVVDGLGLDTLLRPGNGGNLHRHLIGKLTSVFPSTTASANTVFLTGQAPQQHGLTGWHMFFREIGSILAVLPLVPRHGGPTLGQCGMNPAGLLRPHPLADRLPLVCHQVTPAYIVDSDFNRAYVGTARRHGYKNLAQCLNLVSDLVRQGRERQFIHAYWPTLDATAHDHGIKSRESALCFERLDAAFGRFLEGIAGHDSVVLVTADHGFLDSPPDHLVDLKDHPGLAETLMLPLCGERRLAYCYVHPERCGDFEAYVGEHLSERMALYRSRDLLEAGWFGLGPPDPRLKDRIGHYVLALRDDWTLVDSLPGEKRHSLIGVHGGLSAAEMTVPLILARV